MGKEEKVSSESTNKEEKIETKDEEKEEVRKAETEVKATGNTDAVNQPIVNTNALKAQANAAANKAKEGVDSFSKKFNSDRKFQNIVIGVVIAVVVVILGFSLFLNGGSKSAVKGFSKAFVKMDAKKVVKYMSPDYIEYEDDHDYDVEDELDDVFDEMKDNDGKFLSYEITDSEKVDKSDVEDIGSYLDDKYDIKEKNVKAAVVYTIKFKVEVDDEKDTQKSDVTAVKIKGKWYIFTGDLTDYI